MAIRNIQSGLGIVGDDGIGHQRVLVAIVEMNFVVPMMVHLKPVNENLLNSLSVNANHAFRITAYAEVAELHEPDPLLGIDLVSIRPYEQGGFAHIIFIDDVSGGSGPFNTNILLTQDKWLAQLVGYGGDVNDPDRFWHCIEGFLQVLVVGRSNDSRLGGKSGN